MDDSTVSPATFLPHYLFILSPLLTGTYLKFNYNASFNYSLFYLHKLQLKIYTKGFVEAYLNNTVVS